MTINALRALLDEIDAQGGPEAEPWGAAAEEVSKAWAVAAAAYRQQHGLPKDASLPGDALWFHASDDEIVIEFQTEAPARGGCCDCPHEMET